MKRQQTIYVRMEVTAQVRLPIDVPDNVDFDSANRFKTAAINAAVGFLPQSGEIDVSGDLAVPFKTTKVDASMADIFVECADSDVIETWMQD